MKKCPACGAQKYAEGTPDEPVMDDQQAIDPESPAPVEEDADPGDVAPLPPEQAPVAQPEAPAPSLSQELKQQGLAWQQDLQNGHIKPETYHDLFAKKDTLGKIGTLFGLVVGGAGAGLTHQPNAVMEMMNKTIQNDLEAQKSSKENAKNWLQLNMTHQMNQAQIKKMRQEGKLTEAQAKAADTEQKIKAYNLSRIQMNYAGLHSIVEQVNKTAPGSPERAAAEKKLALISQGVQNENFNIADQAEASMALSNAILGGSSGADDEKSFQDKQNLLRLSKMGPLADDRAGRHMPGIEGMASIPLTSGDRDKITSGQSFQDELDRFIDWSKKHSGDLSPSDRKYGQGLAAQLQGAYRKATDGGVYKEGEQGFISHIIDSEPTKFFNSIRVLPSLKAVRSESAAQLDKFLKSKGFKGSSAPGKKPPQEASGETKTMHGATYKKVAGGWKKVKDELSSVP